MSYLSSIGVDPASIEFVVVTHWDQDHISGVVRLAQEATAATIVLSTALRSADFVTLAFRHQQRTFVSLLGSGTKEFVRLLDLIAAGGRALRVVDQDTFLADRDGVRVIALSPSSAVTLEALSAAFVAALDVAETGDSVTEPTPNAASMVLAVRSAGGDVLLGADLERAGWAAALASVGAQGLMARMFKVPHHGSIDADEPAVWATMVPPDAVYAVTRFNNGDRSLPSDADRARMRSRNARGHIVGQPSRRLHLHGIVGRRARAATRNGVWRSTGAVGHYRWRGRLEAATSSVATFGAVEQI